MSTSASANAFGLHGLPDTVLVVIESSVVLVNTLG